MMPPFSRRPCLPQAISTFEEDSVYDQRDAGGFIKINALRLRTLATAQDGHKHK